MTTTRIYLPLALADLERLRADRSLTGPLNVHAVTPALAAGLPGTDEEEREYVALCDAVEAATGLRARVGDRRVVAAADVVAGVVVPAEGDQPASRMSLPAGLELGRIASFHIDEVAGADDDELLWYDATELDAVIAFGAS
ncbi:DUF6912 family protein [Janibacter sp. G1551]|uniref:DUF6912 family protein n=1 Tax=Janibacter sp. G1551 TaxID=3420440 RepID=UPI003D0307E9